MNKDFILSLGVAIFGVFFLFSVVIAVEYKQSPDNFYNSIFKKQIVFNNYSVNHPVIPLPKKQKNILFDLTASSALVIDEYSKVMLFEKNSSEQKMLASITKLMSAIVLLELPRNWQEEILIVESDAHPNGSHYIEVGETYTAEKLWNIALVGSSNKAINALVRTSGVTKAGFVSLMNKKAVELKLNSLNFVEPTGLDEENIGNAQDIVRLLNQALKYKKIKQTLLLTSTLMEEKNKTVWSTNWLKTGWIDNSFDLVVGKTGYIEMSGYNLVVELEKNNHKILVAVFGAKTNEKRFEEARDLGEVIFENFVWPGEEGYSGLMK